MAKSDGALRGTKPSPLEAARNHDIAKALARSGLLIQGEAGVRYALARNCSLPPLTFARAK